MSSSDRDTAVRRPVTALPFRLHASVTCPPPAELAMSLAWELGDFDADRVERALTALGAAVLAELDDARQEARVVGSPRREARTPAARQAEMSEPEAQLCALGEAVTNSALCARREGGPGELMIDRVLERGHGHPVLIAILLQEIGRRAGLPVAIVAGERGHFVAHQRLTEPLVLDPATGRLADADSLGTMRWQCGHQVAAELLDLLQPRYERNGDITRALQVARLRCTLPFEDSSVAEQRLRRVTARLN